MRKYKIGILTLGCSKNTVDSERLAGQLKNNNFRIVEDPNKADIVIINTCGFIGDAKEESVNSILNAVEMKKQGRLKKVIVSGCLSQRYGEELKKEIPEVDMFFGVEQYAGILKGLGGELKSELLGERLLSTPRHYAYMKISEGCNQSCSFCAIPLIRGKHVTYPRERLMNEAVHLTSQGVKELILIGQDTTDYGIDLYGRRCLAELIDDFSGIPGVEWIRLLYAYPSHFPKDVIDVLANNDKFCKYIDMPLQHISDGILKSMRRGITSKRTRELVAALKERVPGIALRSTFIVGYPGETDKDFRELCDFVTETRFDRIGVFKYSPEEDTHSYALNDMDEKIKDERLDILMNLQKEISFENNQKMLGRTLKVIIDEMEGNYYIARSERETPEVDGEILIDNDQDIRIGSFYEAEITDCNEYDLFGRILK